MTRKIVSIAVITVALAALAAGCASKPKVKIIELENKGSSMNVSAPEWIKLYTGQGISKVQSLAAFKDKYCVIGEETGVNKQFVLAWADNFSAQQRIGAMLRTNIASEYQARVQAAAQSTGGATVSTGAGSGEYNQEINSIINSVVNVSYSGAQREADWWSLRRRYDPDDKDTFTDEYTAYVLYLIPKSELNRQIAHALESSVKADSALYSITIEMARKILSEGMPYLGAGELPSAENTAAAPLKSGGPTGKVTITNSSGSTSSVMTMVKIYEGFEAAGNPVIVYNNQVLGGQQVSWELPEGVYTFEVFQNNSTESNRPTIIGSGKASVGITANGDFRADFSGGNISSFYKR
jgi:hypothetical protein